MGTTQLERLENPTDADGVAYHGLITAMEAVDHPDDPPTELAEIAGRLRLRRDDRRVLRWVVHDGDAMIGHVVLVLPDIDNQHLALSNVLVRPDHRRHGLGTALLRAAVAAAAADGRTTFLVEADDGSPGEAFCREHGLREVSRARLSLLRLAAVDWADVGALAAAAHTGYRLVRWTDRCPDELVEQYAMAKTAMNDAPVDGADITDQVFTADVIRQNEAGHREMGFTDWVTVAVHEQTGAVAGLTELELGPPPRAFQEDTAVVPAHRGSGLGLWVKADMLCRLRVERPDVTEVMTGNAASNEHMLRINTRLGFRPHRAIGEWQAGVGDLVSRLA
jgi:GNAT superfamily N-acetyltransferase